MDVGRTGGHCPRVSEIAIIVKTLLGSTIPGTQLTLNTGAASKFVKNIVRVLGSRSWPQNLKMDQDRDPKKPFLGALCKGSHHPRVN